MMKMGSDSENNGENLKRNNEKDRESCPMVTIGSTMKIGSNLMMIRGRGKDRK